MTRSPHFTTRRGFVASLGFGGVSLYGLWVAYGAAPGPLALFAPHAADAATAGAHGGAHGTAAEADVVEEFRRLHADFIDRFTAADGAVQPRALDLAATEEDHQPVPETMAGMDHSGHDMAAMPEMAQSEAAEPSLHSASHGEPADPAQAAALAETIATPHDPAATMADATHGTDHVAAPADAHSADHAEVETAFDEHAAPIEVYLLAERWYFEPAHLRLVTGVNYRFRMLAADIPHGASIELGRGSRMARLRPGAVTEMEMRFDRPGDHLVYCSLYCGQGHDLMQARIEVV